MWSGKGDFTGGDGGGGGFDGGFMNSPSQFASPAPGGAKKERRAQNLVPVTVNQIMKSKEDTIVVAGQDAHMVTIVGVVRSVDITSTKITYTLDDSTGTIEAVQWLESENDNEESQHGSLMEMTYCKVVGTVRSHQGSRNLMVFKIVPLTDINLITTHILEVIYGGLKLEQLNNAPAGGGPVTSTQFNTNSNMSNSFVGVPEQAMSGGTFSGGNMVGLNAQQNQVYQFVLHINDEGGAAREDIYSAMSGKVQRNNVDTILDFLSNEGHIYSTIDDDHFKSTDG